MLMYSNVFTESSNMAVAMDGSDRYYANVCKCVAMQSGAGHEQAGRSVQDINMLMYALVLHCVQLHGGGYRWVRQSQTLCQYIQTYCTAVW